MGTATSTLAGRRRDAIERLCVNGLDQTGLTELSRRLNEVVSFDAAFWSGCDPLTSLATSPALVQGFPESACAPYWHQEFADDDFLRFTDLSRSPRPVGTLHLATDGRPGRSGRHRTVMDPIGLGSEMRVAFVRGGTVWGVAALYRERGRPDFAEDEVQLVADLAPVVAEGMRRSAFSEAGHATGLPHGPGMLLFDESGRLLSMNDPADAWLRLLPPDPYFGRVGMPAHMHTEVVSVMQRSRALARRGAERDAGGAGPSPQARLRVRAGNGLWLVVHASCLAGVDGRGGGQVAVVIEAAKGSEMAPIIAEALGLTAREQEITTAVARGEGTGEIAARLHLSPHTVRDHLKAIFEKAGVSSRGELVARLFSDHYMPRHDPAVVPTG
jgi:DNA-binding CsgD family transcriptional regulator